MTKNGIIRLDMLNPIFLAKKCQKMQTINELFVDRLHLLLGKLKLVIDVALQSKNFMDNLDTVIELAELIKQNRKHIQLDKPNTHGYLDMDDYSIVIDSMHGVMCIMQSCYTSKGKILHGFIPDSIDMSFPSNEGEECYVLGPEWFPRKVPPYDINRREKTTAS